MAEVRFHEGAADELIRFAVIVSRFAGRWVFCQHKQRDTWECPGGHREKGERVLDTARRELWEETGAEEFVLTPVCAYSVRAGEGADVSGAEASDAAVRGAEARGAATYGMLYFAEITRFGALPPLEIGHVALLDTLPDKWTYPEIQPFLLRKAMDAMDATADPARVQPSEPEQLSSGAPSPLG